MRSIYDHHGFFLCQLICDAAVPSSHKKKRKKAHGSTCPPPPRTWWACKSDLDPQPHLLLQDSSSVVANANGTVNCHLKTASKITTGIRGGAVTRPIAFISLWEDPPSVASRGRRTHSRATSDEKEDVDSLAPPLPPRRSLAASKRKSALVPNPIYIGPRDQ